MVDKVSKGEHGKLLVHMSTTGYSTPVMMYLHPIRNQSDRTYNCLIAMMDISEHCAVEDQLRNAKNYLHHIATHDPLTDLPNRRRFNDAVEEAIVTARRNGTKVALLMLDLDRFKFINDSLGHDAGDEMLCQTAKRLKAAVGKDDLVARLGGDEFSIILNGVDDISSVETITEAIRDSLATPFQIGNHEVCTAGSVGVCIYPTDSIHSKEMLKFADAAMYRAKSSGRNCVRFFTQSLSLELKRRLRLESDLRAGIKQQDFDVWFQPIVDIHSGKAKSIEALARWRHPQRGLVSPAEFIGLAEECGAIEPLGYWILSQSCRQLVNLHANGFEDLCLSVNISPRQFAQPGIAREVTEILEVTQLDPKYLELEVTESALFDDDKRSMKVMSELRELGIQLAIDDFGTGYSSFSRLRRLPISRIKIDQSFVRGLPYDADDCSITRAIVSMAGDLGMEVVSEGVETLEQLEYLRNLGCSLVQGYFLGEPVPASRIQKLLSSDKPEIQQPPRENVTPLKIVQTTV
jgi:diguanylate cyclase (GGDEF)-like protein